MACGSYSIAFGEPFPLGNIFRFTKNRFRLFQKHPFRPIWRYNVTVTDLFFLNLSYFINLLLDILCFSLKLLFSLTAYVLCHAPCAIAMNQKQQGKVFFFLSSRLRMLFAVHLVRSRQIRNSEKLENIDFPGKLTKI